MSEEAGSFGDKDVGCCKMRTLLVAINCLCGVGMIVFGVLNFFSAFSLDGQIVLDIGFFFYQMYKNKPNSFLTLL